jgi:hypothetical protein
MRACQRSVSSRLLLAALGASGCSFDLPPFAVHPDARDAGAPDSGSQHAPLPDGGTADGEAQQPAEVFDDFRDDFERADGPVDGAPWKDSGPGVPELWHGALCLETQEQVSALLGPLPFGHVQVSTLARVGFELHLEGDEGEILGLAWTEHGGLATHDGFDVIRGDAVAPLYGRAHTLAFDLDYDRQRVSLFVDADPAVELTMESQEPVRSLRAIRFVHAPIVDAPELQSLCVDNVYAGRTRPSSDPFAGLGALVCTPSDLLAADCEGRRCCAEQASWDEAYEGHALELQTCLSAEQSAQEPWCNPYVSVGDDLTQALVACMQTFCVFGSGGGEP